jgi:transposase
MTQKQTTYLFYGNYPWGQDALISRALRGSRLRKRSGDMSDLFWLTDAQMARLKPYFPKSHGKPRVDDRRVLSGIIFVNRNGLRWRDAPEAYGPHKTLYSRWKRWSEKGIFARMMMGLAAEHGEQKTVMIDATYLKAHRTATSMGVKTGGVAA